MSYFFELCDKPYSELKIISVVTSVQTAGRPLLAGSISGSTANTAKGISEVSPVMTIIGSKKPIMMVVAQVSVSD